MVRIGMNLWFKDMGRLRDLLPRAHAAGMEFVEISLDYPFGIAELEPLKNMVMRVAERGLKIAFHAPWQEIHLASPLEPIRHASVEVMKRTLELAQRFEALYVVVHVTSCQAHCKKLSASNNPCVEAGVRSLAELRDYAEKLGVELYPENTGGACCGKIDQFSSVVTRSGLYACLDVAHAVTSNPELVKRLPQRIELAEVVDEWSAALDNRVALLHLHGVRRRSNGSIESHTDFEQCTLDIKRIVRRLRGSLRFVLFEIFRHSSGNPFDPLRVTHLVKEFRSWVAAYT